MRSLSDPLRPNRPSLTPLFLGGCLLWASCAIAYPFIIVRPWLLSLPVASALIIATVILAALALKLRKNTLALFVAFLVAGLTAAYCQSFSLMSMIDDPSSTYEGEGRILLLEDATDNGYGARGIGLCELPSQKPKLVEANLKGDGPFFFGTEYKGSMFLSPKDYLGDAYTISKGVAIDAKVKDPQEQDASALIGCLSSFRKSAIERLDDDKEGSLLCALACGYREGLSGTEEYGHFQQSGLAHLVAVSGAHLVVVTGAASILLARLGTPRRLAIALLVGIMLAYLILSGMPISALRASIMSSVGILALLGKRRASALNALGAGMIAIVVISPCSSLSISFTLSVLSTAGIVLFAPLIIEWLNRTPLRRFPTVIDALALTIASAILAQLFGASIFALLPLISPLANVCTAPIFTPLCMLALLSALLAGLGIPLWELCAGIAKCLGSILNILIDLLVKVPFSAIPFSLDTRIALASSIVFACILWIAWPTFKMVLVAIPALLLGTFILLFPFSQQDRIIMFDVGQGDAILVESCGMNLLVDTGNKDSQLLESLARHGIFRLDAVAITHGDDDHCGALDALSKAVSVDTFMVSAETLASQAEKPRELIEQGKRLDAEMVGIEAGQSFSIGNFKVNAIWPSSFQDDGGNGDSLCLLLEYDGDHDSRIDSTVLLTGDAEKEQLDAMLKSGILSSVDVLKVGHHGSAHGMTQEQANKLHPKIALIGVGKGNRYGHPAPEILEMLEKSGTAIYRTDEDGEIACTFSASELKVTSVD